MEAATYNRKLHAILDEAHGLRFSDPQEALDKANYVYIQALKSGDEKLEAKSLYEMGRCFELASSYAQAMKCFSESIKIANAVGDVSTMADSINSIGIINDKLGNYSNALKAYFKALRFYEYLQNQKRKAIVLSNIGLIYTNINDNKNALKFYSQALEIAEEEKDAESLLVTNINIGLTHQRLGNIKDAGKFIYDAMAIADEMKDKHRKSMALDILAEIEYGTADYSKAYRFLYESLELKNELNDKGGISKIYSSLGQIQLKENKLEEARLSFDESLKLAEEIGIQKSIFETSKYLSLIYEKLGRNEKALEHLKSAYVHELEYLKEESDAKAKNIATQLEIEQAQKEAELERLKNVELARALEEVKQLNISLKELNDEKNEFMAIAVHDLKNPLQNILSTARVLKSTESTSKEQTAEFMNNIISQTDRMFGLIKKLLDHNSIEQGNIQVRNSRFKIDDLCSEIVGNFRDQADAKKIPIAFERNSEDSEVYTDKELLYEILQNLFSNALKFSQPGKNVVLRTGRKNGKAVIQISDEGPGFTEKDLEKVFTKYARLSARPTGDEHSTGLGLSIVKKLCDFIGADIALESKHGHGAVFTVSLPVVS